MSFTRFDDKPLRTREEIARVVKNVADKRGLTRMASIMTLMGISVEVGANDRNGQRQWWCPANRKDPATLSWPHDSESDDGLSSGYLQQQPGRTPDAHPSWWGTAKQRMTLEDAVDMFMDRLPENYHTAKDPFTAGKFVQGVQGSAFPDRYAARWDEANQVYDRAINSTPGKEGYGLRTGTKIDYGQPGFPNWVYQLGQAFGLKASTYPGHQETDRIEAGFARNPQKLNRGIDWTGRVEDMQRFADYCLSIRGSLEQVIWQNPNTKQRVGVAGGQDVSATGYYAADYSGHQDHVHTRQGMPIPLPQAAQTQFFPEASVTGWFKNKQPRNGRRPVYFILHTQEGGGTNQSLINFMANNQVSYHYVVDNSSAVNVVDTEFASWSVLDANNYSINLVFTASFSAWSRIDWLQKMGNGIKIAAYIAARDCRRYGIDPVVRWGYSASGYPSLKGNSGVTDHNGITYLGIGNHTDVGKNFPWDVFNQYLQQFYSQEDDMFTDEDRSLLREVRDVLKAPVHSRSIYRDPGEGPIGNLADALLNVDGMEHMELVERSAILGDEDSLRRVIRTAAGKGAITDKATVKRAKDVLAQVPAEILAAWNEANQ